VSFADYIGVRVPTVTLSSRFISLSSPAHHQYCIMSKQTTTSNKRKLDGPSAASKKKARSSAPSKDAHAAARELAASINASPETFDLPDDDDDVRRALVSLAAYAKTLEPAEKSSSQIATEVDRLRRTAVSGIKKQMTWKPSCKTGSAKWTYDGICPDPVVFGALFKLDDKPTWKMKKYTADEFENFLGDSLQTSVRYDYLGLKSDVNVRWNESAGEFKFSGSYGK